MNNPNMFFKKKKKNTLTFVIIFVLLIGAILYDAGNSYTSESIKEGISESLIRFHVIANSDLPADQELKLEVKNAILEEMSSILNNSSSIEETRQLLKSNTNKIEEIGKRVVQANNKDYEINASLGIEKFPLKTYGDIVLPPGEYEALVVRIGKAKGKNWWCVLFPPLCFVDATHGVVDENAKQELKNVLTEDEYQAVVMSNKKSKNVKVKVRFKLLDWIEDKENDLIKEPFLANIF